MSKKVLITIFSFIFILSFGLVVNTAESAGIAQYVGYSQADEHGYVKAEVIIENNNILDVQLTEYNDKGEAKGEDYPWDEFHEAMEVLPENFVDGNTHEVDIISGATNTCEKAMEAVKMALEKSEGQTSFDGTYLGTSDVSERGNWGVAWVEVQDGEIVNVDLEEVADGEFKDEDYDWDEYHEAQEQLPEEFKESNSYDVDIYTGATGSSERWIQAVIRALGKAGF